MIKNKIFAEDRLHIFLQLIFFFKKLFGFEFFIAL